MRHNYLDIAKDYINKYHSKAQACFIAGSMLRGEEKSHSDIDIYILYADEYLPKSYRDSVIHNGRMIELFVHRASSYEYVKKSERSGGCAVMMHIIRDGHPYLDNNIAQAKKVEAAAVIAGGPDPFDQAAFDHRRYRISDLADDLRDSRPIDELYAILSFLYADLPDFYLRANKQWSGKAKALNRMLKKYDPAFADRYFAAFRAAFIDGNVKPVLDLCDEVLKPYGGYFWAGYKAEWDHPAV